MREEQEYLFECSQCKSSLITTNREAEKGACSTCNLYTLVYIKEWKETFQTYA
jgi:hypothetical protein